MLRDEAEISFQGLDHADDMGLVEVMTYHFSPVVIPCSTSCKLTSPFSTSDGTRTTSNDITLLPPACCISITREAHVFFPSVESDTMVFMYTRLKIGKLSSLKAAQAPALLSRTQFA